MPKTVEELQAELDAMTSERDTLKTNNNKLVTEKRDALTKAEQAEAAAKAAATAAEEAAANAGAQDELSKLKREHAKLQTAHDKLLNERDTAQADLRTYKVDNEITKALTEGKVVDYLIESLTYQFKAQAKEDGTIDGEPISEAVSKFLASEKGAHFRRAADNSGAGATGNTSTKAPMQLSKRPSNQAEWDYLDSLPTAERNALCDQIKAPDLKL